ncbi:MAG TPA: putative porin [Bacteroidales bacterium]|nr:putative porin [Bacteroidales bacterium]
MSRYIIIILLFSLFSGLYGQKQDSLRIPVKAIQETDSSQFQIKESIIQDSLKIPLKPARKKDTVTYNLKDPPGYVPLDRISLIERKTVLITPYWIIEKKKAADSESTMAKMVRDTVRGPRIIKQWNLSADFSEEVPVIFDTLFTLFNRYRIVDIFTPVNAYLGNYGLPYYSVNFFDRIYDPDKYLYYYHYHFMHNNENALFMNLQVPFTELKWMLSGEKELAEQTFRITHSQNITRKLNFGLIYDIIYNMGQYGNQMADDKSFTFYTSYTGSVYKLYFSAGINKLSGQENGGITSKDELDIDIADTRDIPVKLGSLNDAQSLLKNRNMLAVQKFTFVGAQPDNDTLPYKKIDPVPLTGTFSHIFQLDYSRRSYSDQSPQSGFYDSIYINSSVTFDSLSSKFIKNTFRFDFMTDSTRELWFSAGFGLRNENFWFGQIIPGMDSVVADTVGWFRGNNVILGRFANHIGNKFHWLVTGELFFDRYRQGDFVVNGQVSKTFDLKKGRAEWQVTGGLNKRTPSFWYTRWGGNHFKWDFDPAKESRLEFGTSFSYPARKADLRFNYAMINNYLDFDTLALPSQDTSRLSIMAIALKKDFRLWKFHLVPDVILQKSSNTDLLDLPMATVRAAAYIEHIFNFQKTGGRLYTQLGVDVIYHTLYHPYNYMPVTGRFYRQTQWETGNYPFVNAFLNIKLKRTRFFLMFDHLNYGKMNPELLYNYELVPLYPVSPRRFSFGLAWTFYN